MNQQLKKPKRHHSFQTENRMPAVFTANAFNKLRQNWPKTDLTPSFTFKKIQLV